MLSKEILEISHIWNIEVKILGCYLRNVATELFALKREIGALRFVRRARKLRKRTRYYLKGVANLLKAIGASRVAKNIMKSEPMISTLCGLSESLIFYTIGTGKYVS